MRPLWRHRNEVGRGRAVWPRGASVLVALGLLGGCLTVPMQPDQPALTQFAAPAAPGVEMRLLPLRVGYQDAPGCFPASGASCLTAVDIVHAAFIVQHPRATFLIESTLSSRVAEDMARFSFVDRQTFAHTSEGSLKGWMQRLKAAGWAAPEFVLITHAHWDHTSGLVDLDHPRVILGPGEAEFVRAFPADQSPTVMPHHLSGAALETFAWDGPAYENFPASHDLFGDGAVVLVPLPGHTPGSLGVFVNTVRGRRVLFVGDAAWSSEGIELPSHKLGPMSHKVDHDTAALSATLWRLHHLQRKHPDLLIVPTHGGDAFERLRVLATTPGLTPGPSPGLGRGER